VFYSSAICNAVKMMLAIPVSSVCGTDTDRFNLHNTHPVRFPKCCTFPSISDCTPLLEDCQTAHICLLGPQSAHLFLQLTHSPVPRSDPARAEQSSRGLKRALAQASHAARTPCNSIAGTNQNSESDTAVAIRGGGAIGRHSGGGGGS
jgi:hypothetical protein